MREIEAIMRVIVGAALSDGHADSRELSRIRILADAVGAKKVMNAVMTDVHRHQGQLNTTAQVIAWAQPAAARLSTADQQTRFLAACAIDRVIKEDGRLAADESTYRGALLAFIGKE